MLVQGHEDHRRHQRVRHLVHGQLAEFAAVNTALHGTREKRVGWDDDFIGIKLRQVGEVAYL